MSFGKFSKSENYKKAETNYRNGVAMEKLKFQNGGLAHYDHKI